MTERQKMILDRYNAEGMQGVYSTWGDSGVYELLRRWDPWRTSLKVENDVQLTIGADFCWHGGGGNIYSQGQMGVYIGASGSFGSGGVFTMTAEGVALFKSGIDQVDIDRDGIYRRAENPMELRLAIPNYRMGVSDSYAGEIRIARQKTDAHWGNLIFQFLPADLGRVVVISSGSVFQFKQLLDEALLDVQLYASVEKRGKILIERGRATKRAE